jgi:hypothetical protein
MGHVFPVRRTPSAGALLRDYWKKRKNTWYRTGPKLRPGASERELCRFESKYGVRLPEDMRSYFGLVDGMEYASSEGEGIFSFWELSRVRPFTEEFAIPQNEHYLKIPHAESHFCFADSMIAAEVYGIFLSADPTAKNVIVGHKGVPRAGSFSEFAMKYMESPDELV